MFERFLERFKVDVSLSRDETTPFNIPFEVEGLQLWLEQYGGCSFNQGLYRAHSVAQINLWNKLIGENYPHFKGRVFCFAYDWAGRQFALDFARMEHGEPLVLLLDPATGEAFDVPTNFLEFHNQELAEDPEPALSESFFLEWLAATQHKLQPNECVGYKVPLFLGGKDELANLEVTDLEVYWTLSGQMLEQIKDLPAGTPIGKVTIN
ncbi:T6SS immunity protein Tdi1 domain-containing protein [Pseudovibrio ascidiaceicola]|uniref:T6SS immunity protein Tdi1 domain-containing protein n=1 Tax=Pseudovibrio ascidiaceicola TaxID=285279 RepID=UPI001AD8B5CA|nr:T6SS immunity protein Tdi1 domain-containing protein [Pseudovibrio ascidiaceicola]